MDKLGKSSADDHNSASHIPVPNLTLNQKSLSYLSTCLLRQYSASVFHQSLLLPSTAEGLVKLHERQTLVELGLHQVEFR